MCGLNGIWGLQNASSKVNAMNDALAHRGPDDHGLFEHGKVTLGHRRLSIIDLSSAGHQPMSSADERFVIVFNGEIYNYRELRLELQRVQAGSAERAYFFKTDTDTEVILAAWERWGADCLKKLNGMFAFALYDRLNEQLFVVRDRMGIKPLYYYFSDGVFAFSSEIRSLLASGLAERKVSRTALAQYVRFQTVYAPDTIVEGVKMLMPGHMIAFSEGAKIIKWWDPAESVVPHMPDRSYQDICRDVRTLLTRSVESRLVADVPFGAFLSGGIDSSAIVGLMSQVSSSKVYTFNISFDDSEFSEARYARLIATRFATEHHEIRLTPSDFLEQLPEALAAMDHPSGDGPNTYVVSGATKKSGVTMALSGIGGDEVFAGYDIFHRAPRFTSKAWIGSLPLPLRKVAASVITSLKKDAGSHKVADLLRSNFTLADFARISRQVVPQSQAGRLLSRDEDAGVTSLSAISALKLPLLSLISLAEMQTYLQNILLRDTDQMSMAHALEVREPFLDYRLVEYVLGVPDKFKNPVTPKKLLTDALGDLLPPEIIHRPKMGFTLPWKNWMRNELHDFCQQRMIRLSGRELFNGNEVRSYWERFLRNDPAVSWSRIWHLVVLEEWLAKNGLE